MSHSFDVIIVGGGLVGAGLALALAPANLSVALIEPRLPQPVPDDGSWDSRIYAISPGSAAFLGDCGAWPGVPQERVTRVETMQVCGDDAHSRLDFSAYDAGLRELAFIAENRLLHDALWQRLQRAEHVRIFCPAHCTSAEWHGHGARLWLDDGAALDAKLTVGADGGDSWLRTQAGIEIRPRDYGHLGVVANFSAEHAHRGTAYQWFLRSGILALLPLPGRRVSMVWSTPEPHGRELLALAPAMLAEQVEAASGSALGRLECITPAAAFPLRLQRVEHIVKSRIALVGDAAHNVHPLAGQGVNLGLRDARELASVMLERGAQNDCGDYALLRRYERARKEDILALQLTTDALQKLFSYDAVWLSKARNLGLGLVNSQPQLKRMLVQQAVS